MFFGIENSQDQLIIFDYIRVTHVPVNWRDCVTKERPWLRTLICGKGRNQGSSEQEGRGGFWGGDGRNGEFIGTVASGI